MLADLKINVPLILGVSVFFMFVGVNIFTLTFELNSLGV